MSNVLYHGDKSVLIWKLQMIGAPGKKCCLFSRAEGNGNYSYYRPVHGHHPLHSFYRKVIKSKRGCKCQGSEEVCETAGAPAGWSVLASPCREMRNKRVTDRQKLCKSISLSFLLEHNVTFKVQSLHNKSQLHFFFGNIALNIVLWTC